MIFSLDKQLGKWCKFHFHFFYSEGREWSFHLFIHGLIDWLHFTSSFIRFLIELNHSLSLLCVVWLGPGWVCHHGTTSDPQERIPTHLHRSSWRKGIHLFLRFFKRDPFEKLTEFCRIWPSYLKIFQNLHKWGRGILSESFGNRWNSWGFCRILLDLAELLGTVSEIDIDFGGRILQYSFRNWRNSWGFYMIL